MASAGNWEIVGKNKKNKQNGHTSSKLSKVEKKKFAEHAPKVEDILPLAQVKSLYTDDMIGEIHEVKKPEKEMKVEAKKTQKKVPQHSDKRKDVKEKRQPAELDEGELLALIVDARSRYSEAPLAWLRDMATYITSRLNPSSQVLPQNQKAVDSEWPGSLLPLKVRKALEGVFLEETSATQIAFFSSCMTSMANDLSKGHSAIGQKIMLNILINLKPYIVAMNVDKLISIRNSYQNRPPIGIGLLEMMGLAGHKDINIGLKIWCEVMFPLVEMRHYSRWVVSYLSNLTTVHSHRIMKRNLAKGEDINTSLIKNELYFQVIERILPIGNSLTSQIQKDLIPLLEPLRELAVHPSIDEERISEFFLGYLHRLMPSSPQVLQNELLEGLIHCLRTRQECFGVWCTFYRKYLPQSALLLHHLSSSGEKSSLARRPLKEALLHFESINTNLMSQKEGRAKGISAALSFEGLEETSHAINDILQKAESSPKENCFPFAKGSLLCSLGIIGLIIYDVRRHGGDLKDSSIGHLLSDVGALDAVQSTLLNVEHYYTLCLEWAHANMPTQVQTGLDMVKPVILNGTEYVSHLASCSYTRLMELHPVIINWIDEQAPGYKDKCIEYLTEGWTLLSDNLWVTLEQSKGYATVAVKWARDNVFVGNLSPEKIQKFSLEAYNFTQVYAALTYNWIMEKVH